MATLERLLERAREWETLPSDIGPDYQIVRANLDIADDEVLVHHLHRCYQMFADDLMVTKGASEKRRTVTLWTKQSPVLPNVSMITIHPAH